MKRDIASFEIKELIGEYDFVAKQLYQMKDVTALMLEIAAAYKRDEKMKSVLEEQYGIGMADFLQMQ